MPEPTRDRMSLDEMMGLGVPGSAAGGHGRGGPTPIVAMREAADLLRKVVAPGGDPGEPGAIATQLYEIGNRSAIFLCISMGFIGMIFVYQAGLQMLRVIPELSQLGATFLELLVRDFAASICALLLATRVGAGIAAELGSMVVTEQIDALRMCAADPARYLVRPRFIASIVMTTVLTIVAGCVAFATGAWTAFAFFGLNPRTFVDLSLVDGPDLATGLAKCLAYGAAIPIVSARAGLAARGGSAGVGRAATDAVVGSSLAVIALDFVISAVAHFAFG